MNIYLVTFRRSAYRILGFIDSLLGRKSFLTVYCYHSISDDGWQFSNTIESFKEQMQYLRSIGEPISTEKLTRYLQGKYNPSKSCFLVTFDDGYKDILQAIPVCKELGIEPIAFVLSDPGHARRDTLKTEKPFLSNDDIKKLIHAGWTIGSHSATHSLLQNNPIDIREQEITNSKMTLERIFSTKINCIAYPVGKYSAETLTQVSHSGYTLGFSMDDKELTQKSNSLAIPRVGVDGTHSMAEYKVISSPSVIAFRRFINTTFGDYL